MSLTSLCHFNLRSLQLQIKFPHLHYLIHRHRIIVNPVDSFISHFQSLLQKFEFMRVDGRYALAHQLFSEVYRFHQFLNSLFLLPVFSLQYMLVLYRLEHLGKLLTDWLTLLCQLLLGLLTLFKCLALRHFTQRL